MKLSEYFEKAEGIGVLATADAEGKVNAAIYARPYFPDEADETTLAFIMGDRNSHDNVCANPSAAYLFIEEGADYLGKRLSLTRIKEEADRDKIRSLCRRKTTAEEDVGKIRFLVYFRIDGVRPLIGTGET
ncbi:MAG: pyridoxamine 5'-phosphate oxidase family protein [Pirellulales bacterium]|nr:pyridoxamine 5'-phosphate oxidase family protein [Pirellulales bacterium]